MRRRDLLVAGGSGAAMFALGWKLSLRGEAPATSAPSDGPPPKPDPQPAPSQDLPDVEEPFPSPAGVLTESQKQQLWEICSTLGALWSMNEVTRGELSVILDLKTQVAPSYLEEYRNALEIYGVQRDRLGATPTVQAMWKGAPLDHAAMVALDFDPSSHDDVALSRTFLAHAREFVLAEFVRLYLARGGCRHFGLVRYPGLVASAEPYRTSSVQPGTRRSKP